MDYEINKQEEPKTFIKEVQIGDTWEEIECEYEIINNCAIEKGGDYLAFANEGAIIPDYVKTIGSRAFSHREIKSITFPKSVEVIEELGCADCYFLESVTLNEGLKKIGNMAFVRTKIKSLRIPKSVEEIDGYAFGDIELTIDPENPKYEVRGNCLIEKETKKVINGMKYSQIPNDIKIIAEFAFLGSSIESITIPNSVEIIEDDAFSYSKLKEVKLNEGLKKIGLAAFKSTKLNRIVIPSTVEQIGIESFDDIEFSVAEGNKKYEVRGNCIIEKEAKKIILGGKDSKIPEDIIQIEDRAFTMCKLRSLIIPRNVKEIGEGTFSDCENMRNLNLQDGLEKIGKFAFCTLKIKKFVLPSTVESIGECAFLGCSKLKSIKINRGLQSIGNSAFSDTKIRTIVIPDTVVDMGEFIFGDCDNLKTIYCRVKAKPDGWDANWDSKYDDEGRYNVVWGYTGK